MTVAVGDVLRVVAEIQDTELPTIVQNIFHYRPTILGDPSEAAVFSNFQVRMLALWSDITDYYPVTSSLNRLRVTNLTKHAYVGEDIGALWTGTGAGFEPMPAQVAVLALSRTTNLGQNGRKYLGPTIQPTWVDGKLPAATLANFELFQEKWEAQFTDAGNTFDSGVARQDPLEGWVFTPFQVGRGVVFDVSRTQRRRRPGVGIGG